MALSAETANQVKEPAFITYLLDPAEKYDCYFLVGNQQLTTPVKIGVVKKMLLAHSQVLRLELQDSKMAEKGTVTVTDLYPDTFKSLLKFVYGYDKIDALCFDDADNLLYAAEKYLIAPLKDKLAVHLMSLLNYENICTLMNNPACYQHLELNSEITKILQWQTTRVLATPQFLELTSEAFLKLLEQETLAVREVEVWRAALKWAKHRAESEDGLVLRQQLTEQVKQIRFCTMTSEEVCTEVVPSQVLTVYEIGQVCVSVGLKKKQDKLTEICNRIESRSTPGRNKDLQTYSDELQCYFGVGGLITCSEGSFTILTEKYGIDLMSFRFMANSPPSSVVPPALTYQCECSINIYHITDYIKDTSDKVPVTVIFNKQVMYDQYFKVPVVDNTGQNVHLLPNNKYRITVKFNTRHRMWRSYNNKSTFEHEHFTIAFVCDQTTRQYYTPIETLYYRTVT